MLNCLCFFSNKCGTHVLGGVGNVMKYPGALLTNGEYSFLKTESRQLSNVYIDKLFKPLLVSKMNILSLFK